MNSGIYSMAVVIAVCLLLPFNPGFCESDITIQGTEKLDEIHTIIQTVVQHIRDQDADKAIVFTKDTKELWQAFTVYYEEVFAGEINPPDGTDELFSGITGNIGELEHNLKAGNLSESLGKAQVLLDAVASLNDKLALPILFDFTGPKCKSCKVMKARLTQVAPDYTGKVRIVLVDVNVKKDFTRKFKIMLIPTLIFIDKTGSEIGRHVGQMEEPALRAELVDLIERSGPVKR